MTIDYQSLGMLLTFIIAVGGWFITGYLYNKSKKHADELHKKTMEFSISIHEETETLTKKIHRVELTQNRPILVPVIDYKPFQPEDPRDKEKYAEYTGKEFYHYELENEGKLAVEFYCVDTFFEVGEGKLVVQNEGDWIFSSRKSGIRIPPGSRISYIPSLLFVKKHGKQTNPFYERDDDRLIRVEYRDSAENEYCSCVGFGKHGLQNRLLKNREFVRDNNPPNFDANSNLCKDCLMAGPNARHIEFVDCCVECSGQVVEPNIEIMHNL